MDYLPLFFNLQAQPCLLVGGGGVALRKARLLIKAGALVKLVAPEIDPELRALVTENGGEVRFSHYSKSCLKAVRLVISATDDPAVNRQVAADCNAAGVPVNVVDNPALCSVIMPAIIDRSPLMIAVSSGGVSPVLARMVRAKLESTIPAHYGNLAKLASEFRDQVKARFASEDDRRRFWEAALAGEVAEKALATDLAGARAMLQQKIDSAELDSKGEVYLVGAGPGDPELLTFKAFRLMQQAEVVLYDRLVSAPILDLVRRDAERIYVGKRMAEHSMAQTDINQLLLTLAQQGKRVLRLKGGDPFIFGRGGEEIELLAEHRIAFQVVPGITAASGCASYAGIPLTHRDYAHSVRFITGHLKSGSPDLPWQELTGDGQTLVFYMGLSGLARICEQLIAHGKDAVTPVALIAKGTTVDQQVHVSTLAELPNYVADRAIRAPTLLIIGGVVNLHSKLAWFQAGGEA